MENIPRSHCVRPREDTNFTDRIIFMSMNNDIQWGARRNPERCECNSQTVANCSRRFLRGHWSFLGPGSEEKWYGTCSDRRDGSWNQSAENMTAIFSGSNISCLQCFREENYEAEGDARSQHTSTEVMRTSSYFFAE